MSLNIQFWHMQIHPKESCGFGENVPEIWEHHQFIGLGDWEEGEGQIDSFCNKMNVNDIVALKRGQRLIALVQVIGGAYKVQGEQPEELEWIVYRRPIRVLDWAIEEKTIPQARGALNKCVSGDVETTQIIENWYKAVHHSYQQRKIPLFV